jgi:hypothetical protein
MKGILFKPDVWQAKKKVLEQYGEAQTRRLINFNHNKRIDGADSGCYDETGYDVVDGNHIKRVAWTNETIYLLKPRYQVGEVVYRKEAYLIYAYLGGQANIKYYDPNAEVTWLHYPKDNPRKLPNLHKKHSPLHLPAWAARDFLQITAVRAERLQEITEADAIAEGIPPFAPDGKVQSSTIPRKHYANLWNSINKENQWASNPWAWVYTFKPVSKEAER